MKRKAAIALMPALKQGEEANDMSTPREADATTKERLKKRRERKRPALTFSMSRSMQLAASISAASESTDEEETKADRFLAARVCKILSGHGSDIQLSCAEKARFPYGCEVCGAPIPKLCICGYRWEHDHGSEKLVYFFAFASTQTFTIYTSVMIISGFAKHSDALHQCEQALPV